MTEEANEQGQQAEANPSKAPPPAPPPFDPDLEMIVVELRKEHPFYHPEELEEDSE
jgi:hypothetical protein